MGTDATRKAAATGTGTVITKRGLLRSIIVTTVIGAGAITVYDNTSAAGTVMFSIPAAAPVGTVYSLDGGIPFDIGIHAVFASTGTVLFVFD